jgi:hypothetical protein
MRLPLDNSRGNSIPVISYEDKAARMREREREDKDLWEWIKVLTVVVDTLIREMRDLQQ